MIATMTLFGLRPYSTRYIIFLFKSIYFYIKYDYVHILWKHNISVSLTDPQLKNDNALPMATSTPEGPSKTSSCLYEVGTVDSINNRL